MMLQYTIKNPYIGWVTLRSERYEMTTTPTEHRDTREAVLRGLMHRCPACGKGHLFRRYLKVNDTCPECGEELYHHRADDGPAYLTILLVGHIMGFALHGLFGYMRDDPLMLALVLCSVATVLSLLVLPRMKGLLIGYQWAKEMHGFGKARTAA